ncbi:hypothetical protein [Psychromonas sp. Urea-02u-13]|uniref:hypothetical protein n=1 Tax=Psychromonas sp. Urea-02u-13 TaxID=2058326 RepID=UPI000C33B2C5|nr:hypothetical protein [Psychromonas sp. Urea-02u-13]PKG37059.1 hypothetical protein CXF74_20875 [Psychromonas sp. Urea-02u-13]
MLLELDRFLEIIEEIDSSLAAEQLDIAARPMHATIKVLNLLGIDAPLAGRSVETASLPITVNNISSHVNSWYQGLYEDTLKVDFSLGTIPFMVRGEVFDVKVPLTYGQILVVSSKETMTGNNILNAVDMVQNLPTPLRARFTPKEENELQAYFVTAHKVVAEMSRFKGNDFIDTALKDSFVSCENLTIRPKSPDLSSWHSAQFAEKVMKFYISHNSGSVKFTHKFKDLLKETKKLGYNPDSRINWPLLSSVTPTARYETGKVNASTALSINIEAWRVAFDIMHQIKA